MVTTVHHEIMPQQLLRKTLGTAETHKKCHLKFFPSHTALSALRGSKAREGEGTKLDVRGVILHT